LHFNFVLGNAIRSVQLNQDGLKLNGTYQLLLYADDINTRGIGRKLTHYKEKHRNFNSCWYEDWTRNKCL